MFNVYTYSSDDGHAAYSRTVSSLEVAKALVQVYHDSGDKHAYYEPVEVNDDIPKILFWEANYHLRTPASRYQEATNRPKNGTPDRFDKSHVQFRAHIDEGNHSWLTQYKTRKVEGQTYYGFGDSKEASLEALLQNRKEDLEKESAIYKTVYPPK